MMTTEQYLNMDLADFLMMNNTDLKKAIVVLSRSANKRYRILKKSVGNTPATQALERSGGVISSKGLSFNQMRREFIRAKNFLNLKTSTIEGYEEVKNKSISGLAKKGVHISEDEFKNFWEIYEKVKEIDPMVGDKQYKYHIIEYIRKNMYSMDEDTLIKNCLKKLKEMYEMAQSHENTEFWTNLFEQQR